MRNERPGVLRALGWVVATAALAAMPAFAAPCADCPDQPKPASFDVVATVITNCVVGVDAHVLNFGEYDPVKATSTSLKSKTKLTWACTPGTKATLHLRGHGSDRACADGKSAMYPRGITSKTAPAGAYPVRGLAYTLFQDANHTRPWGCGEQSGMTVKAKDNLTHTLEVFGEVAAGQSLPAGRYWDNVVVTIKF